MKSSLKKIVIVGGGAAGFFAAITCAENNPDSEVLILEQSNQLLQKVKISGGGRCNVTHFCFDARELAKHYPRGEKQLIGPFKRFNPTHTFEWFALRGVELKTEADGRCFPLTNSSQTIVDCFLGEARRLKITIRTHAGVDELKPMHNKQWQLKLSNEEIIIADAVIVAAGSSLRIWKMLKELGHTIIPAVPSLFTFNIKDERLKDLQGIALPLATVRIISADRKNNPEAQTGALLVTHWGLSGPAILRLSAWGARALADVHHKFIIEVNWCGAESQNEIRTQLLNFRHQYSKKNVLANTLFGIPKRLWERIVLLTLKNPLLNFADLSNKQIDILAKELTAATFQVIGKSTFKDEFVTAGGVKLDEVDFKTMESKKFPSLHFAGEVLDIDAITGGFNFQAAWTTGFIAGSACCK